MLVVALKYAVLSPPARSDESFNSCDCTPAYSLELSKAILNVMLFSKLYLAYKNLFIQHISYSIDTHGFFLKIKTILFVEID